MGCLPVQGVPLPGVVVRGRVLALVPSLVGRLFHPVARLPLPAGMCRTTFLVHVFRTSFLVHGRVLGLSIAFWSMGDLVIFGVLLGPYSELLLIGYLLR